MGSGGTGGMSSASGGALMDSTEDSLELDKKKQEGKMQFESIVKEIVKEEVVSFLNEQRFGQPTDLPSARLASVGTYVLRAAEHELKNLESSPSKELIEDLLGALNQAFQIGYEKGELTGMGRGDQFKDY
jgi:hypothetical protein